MSEPESEAAPPTPPAEPLSAEVTALLELLLAGDDPVRTTLRRQIPLLRAAASCRCGCPSLTFGVADPGRLVAAPAAEHPIVAEAMIDPPDGDSPGEVLVFARGGVLTDLELASWSDITPSEWPPPEQLSPYSRLDASSSPGESPST
jgi:hypothetical protein